MSTAQYAALNTLHADRRVRILAFPCNQFGGQEPLPAKEVEKAARKRFKLAFALMEKVDVNGGNAHPLFEYVKKHGPAYAGVFRRARWNFEKFLVDNRTGKVVDRFAPPTSPLKVVAHL